VTVPLPGTATPTDTASRQKNKNRSRSRPSWIGTVLPYPLLLCSVVFFGFLWFRTRDFPNIYMYSTMSTSSTRPFKRSRTRTSTQVIPHGSRLRRGPSLWPGKNDLKVYRFVQKAPLQSITVLSGNSSAGGGMFFALDALTQYASFQAVFDQYRIAKVKVEFLPRGGVSQFVTSSNLMSLPGPPGNLITAVDFEDATAETPPALLTYQSAVLKPGYAKQVRVFAPRVALGAYSGAFTSYANAKSQWIDAKSPSVQHYGCKWSFDYGTNIATNWVVFDILVTYFVEFRSVH